MWLSINIQWISTVFIYKIELFDSSEVYGRFLSEFSLENVKIVSKLEDE